MNKSTLTVFALVLLSFSFTAFVSAQELQILPTKLRVTVIDGNGNFVEGATVTIFTSEEDYINNKNPFKLAKSEKKGKVVFKGLEPKVYYLDVRKGEQNNDGRGSQIDQLKEGRVNKVNVVIE